MILLIDNYDSFVYNLVQGLGTINPSTPIEVVRNDAITAEEVAAKGSTHLILSPGPCTPNEAGVSMELVRRFAETIPILGVCLGHQCIGQVFGGKIVRAAKAMHGKTSPVFHNGDGLFRGMSNPFTAARYHSLIIEPESFIRADFEITAWTAEGEIMAIRHREWPLYGVQFHPESFLTDEGPRVLRNFLEICSRGL